MSIFKTGFNAVRQEKERQERERENRTRKLWNFFLADDGEEADVIFLTSEPLNYYVHTVPKNINGKTRYEDVVCTGSKCELCANGDRPRFVGSFLIVDKREYKDKNGNVVSNQVKIYTQGTKVLSQLDRYATKYGLTNREYTIVRIGKGQNTTYTFERGDKIELTPEEIENLLPDFLREMYDGTEESLIEILKQQVLMSVPTGNDDEDDDYEEELNDSLVSLDNEGEETPKISNKKSSFKNKFKPKENNSKKATKLKLSRK